MDEITTFATISAGLGGANVVQRLLGPTADYLGTAIADINKKRIADLRQIFEKAAARCLDAESVVSPKVLKEIVAEAGFCQEEVAIEYLGGLLASGRTEVGRDDRAASYARIVGQLTTYQLRMHYIAYMAFRREFRGTGLEPEATNDCKQMALLLPLKSLAMAMEFVESEPADEIIGHCITGLDRLQLLGFVASGGGGKLNRIASNWRSVSLDEGGAVVFPTHAGIELFMWALCDSTELGEYLSAESEVAAVKGIEIPADASRFINM